VTALPPAATVVTYGRDASLSERATGEQRTFVDGGAERLAGKALQGGFRLVTWNTLATGCPSSEVVF
jgi:hypothetical protein